MMAYTILRKAETDYTPYAVQLLAARESVIPVFSSGTHAAIPSSRLRAG